MYNVGWVIFWIIIIIGIIGGLFGVLKANEQPINPIQVITTGLIAAALSYYAYSLATNEPKTLSDTECIERSKAYK